MKSPTAHDLYLGLKEWLQRHDKTVSHIYYKKGEIYERRMARPKNDGKAYVFALVGPHGSGFYKCWCNPTRDLLARWEEKNT